MFFTQFLLYQVFKLLWLLCLASHYFHFQNHRQDVIESYPRMDEFWLIGSLKLLAIRPLKYTQFSILCPSEPSPLAPFLSAKMCMCTFWSTLTRGCHITFHQLSLSCSANRIFHTATSCLGNGNVCVYISVPQWHWFESKPPLFEMQATILSCIHRKPVHLGPRVFDSSPFIVDKQFCSLCPP